MSKKNFLRSIKNCKSIDNTINTTQDIQKAFTDVFKSACLKFDFCYICTKSKTSDYLKFLDVIDNNYICVIFTKNFTKPTALN